MVHMEPVGAFHLHAALLDGLDLCRIRGLDLALGTWRMRIFPIILTCLCLLLFAVSGATAAPPNLNITQNTIIASDAEYNIISGSGSDLEISGAQVSAQDVVCASVRLLGLNARLTAANNIRLGRMLLENSTLTAGNVLQSTATGIVVMENSRMIADVISLGWDYILNDGSLSPEGVLAPSGAQHQPSNSVLTARQKIIFYGGLDAVGGNTVVTVTEGDILAGMADGLRQRPGATLTLAAPNGNIKAREIVAANLTASGISAANVTMQGGGSFTLKGGMATNSISGALTLQNTASSIAALAVGGPMSVSGGTLQAGQLNTSGGLTVNDHAQAVVDSLALANGSLLAVNSRVAVNAFRNSTGASAVVGNNAVLGLGTSDSGWILRQFNNVNASYLAPVTAALAVAAPQSFAALPGLVVDGSLVGAPSAVASGSALFASDSLVVVSAAAAAENGVGALSGGNFTVQSGAKLYIPDAVNGGTYKVLNGTGTYADESSWNGDNLASGTPMLDLVRLAEFGMIGTRMVPSASAFPGLHPAVTAAQDAAFAAGLIGPQHVNSDVAGIRFLSRAISRDYIANDAHETAITIESAARMAALGATPQMTLAAHQAGADALGQRTGTEPGCGLQGVNEDGAPIDVALKRQGWALWLMPLFQSVSGFGLSTGHRDIDFSGNLGGLALGLDYTFASAARLGLSLNLGGGYARGSGELAATANHMNFWGFAIYGGWQKGNFALSADLDYVSAFHSLKQTLPKGMEMRPLKGEISSWILGAGLRAAYKIATPWLDVMPHAGLRYCRLHSGDYELKSNGAVLDGESMRQNIWTFPIGIAFSRELELRQGWLWRPTLDMAVIPAAGDLASKGVVRFTGTDADLDLSSQIMDDVVWRGALGVEFSGGDVALGLRYSFQGGMKTTSQGVTASFSYQF